MRKKSQKTLAMASAAVGIVGVIAAIVLSLMANAGATEANNTAKLANYSAARSEITGYATQMVQLDRAADERNGIQISVLAEQADSVLRQYGDGNLMLAPATYRVLAEFSALDVENRDLAKSLAAKAVAAAARQNDTVEQIRAERAWATAFAQEGNPIEMDRHLKQALMLSKTPSSKALKDATRFTGSMAIYLSIMAADATDESSSHKLACRSASSYYAQFHDLLDQSFDNRSLEVSRRAYALRNHIGDEELCSDSRLTPQALHLVKFKTTWVCNPVRRETLTPGSCHEL